jgi:hypothetical protein
MAIRVLTDPEAVEYNAKHFKGYIRRSRLCHGRQLEVDTSKLSDQEKRSHERSVLIQATKLAALDSVRRVVPVTVHERSTPAVRMPSLRSPRP